MRYIEPHGHMVSRTTNDYQAMALSGCRCICEPAFWAGFDRSSPAGFHDYFRQLTVVEPARAAKFGLSHYCWLCINPKEAEDPVFAREVMALIPEFITSPHVLGIGEIGLNKNTRNELQIFEEHLDIAVRFGQMVLIHTPHLEDKLKGTRLILDALRNQSKLDPARIIVDHVEEHTIAPVLEAGFWAGMTLYPDSKCSVGRAVDMLEIHGPERLWLNSACDWGISDPLAVPKAGQEMRSRGFSHAQVDEILYRNPARFLAQSPNFRLPE